jgi:hypothetical protein
LPEKISKVLKSLITSSLAEISPNQRLFSPEIDAKLTLPIVKPIESKNCPENGEYGFRG